MFAIYTMYNDITEPFIFGVCFNAFYISFLFFQGQEQDLIVRCCLGRQIRYTVQDDDVYLHLD